jgi:hypothetical protein
MPDPRLDQLIADVRSVNSEVRLIQEKLRFLDKVKIEGHGKLIVSGAELKVNASVDIKTLLNRIQTLEDNQP